MSDVLRVNPIACDAHGLCAELVPELIRLDEWGYPIVAETPVPREAGQAREARGRGVPGARAHARPQRGACSVSVRVTRGAGAFLQGNRKAPDLLGRGMRSALSARGGSMKLLHQTTPR